MKKCLMCNRDNTTSGKYCNSCYAYYRRHPEGVYDIPPIGKITYAPNGDPICHICGQAHRKLGSHIKLKHNLTQIEYREKFKLYHNTRLSNLEYREKMADYNRQNRDVVVKKNLLEKGKKTRISEKYYIENRRKYGKPIEELYIVER